MFLFPGEIFNANFKKCQLLNLLKFIFLCDVGFTFFYMDVQLHAVPFTKQSTFLPRFKCIIFSVRPISELYITIHGHISSIFS